MTETPDQAQARLWAELGPPLNRMGFRLAADTPGHLHFAVRYIGWLLTGLPTILLWFARLLRGESIRIDFTPAPNGTLVEVYGRAGRGIADLIDLLGRQGHWPENRQDPDWIPELADDPLAAWDHETIDSDQLDRTTRRALQKAGRL